MKAGRKPTDLRAPRNATLAGEFEIVGAVVLTDSAIEALASLLIDIGEHDLSKGEVGREVERKHQ